MKVQWGRLCNEQPNVGQCVFISRHGKVEPYRVPTGLDLAWWASHDTDESPIWWAPMELPGPPREIYGYGIVD